MKFKLAMKMFLGCFFNTLKITLNIATKLKQNFFKFPKKCNSYCETNCSIVITALRERESLRVVSHRPTATYVKIMEKKIPTRDHSHMTFTYHHILTPLSPCQKKNTIGFDQKYNRNQNVTEPAPSPFG